MMKKLFLLGALIAVMLPLSNAKAQTLAFSRVLLVSSAPDTVPAGKVWKIESISSNSSYHVYGGSSCTSDANALQVYVDGNSLYLVDNVSTGATTARMMGRSFPLWLPAGTSLYTQCAATKLSVVEFSVVP